MGGIGDLISVLLKLLISSQAEILKEIFMMLRRYLCIILALAVLITGCSSPAQPAEKDLLNSDWETIVSTADGTTVNFYMWGGDERINRKKMVPEIFGNLDWGKGSVLEQTIVILDKCNVSWSLLPQNRDIDA